MVVSRTPHMTDYEAERRGFHLEVPEYFNFATDVIGKWASDPNKLAMLWIGQNGEERHVTFAELRCQDLVLMARLLVEQGAMLEAAHDLGMDHPANRDACRALFRASLESLELFDRKLSAGMSLAEALAVEVLLESLTTGSAPSASAPF